jgi:cob(I)alamin adenosyltransferase
MKGLVHIYTGGGKGKTTAAIGLGMRACGRGLKVLMYQFLKGAETGEIFSLQKLEPGFILIRGTELRKFTWDMSKEELRYTKIEQEALFVQAVNAAKNAQCDVLILDELMGAISSGMIDVNAAADFIKAKPDGLELVLTGRNAPDTLLELADYISDIRAAKHPMDKGVNARKGIEF